MARTTQHKGISMKELNELVKEETTNEMDLLAQEREDNATFKWLTDSLKTTMFDSITKAAKGIEITKHNNMIVKLSAIFKNDMTLPEAERVYNVDNANSLFSVRKTKKGQSFYGYETELYQAVRGAESSDLAAL